MTALSQTWWWQALTIASQVYILINFLRYGRKLRLANERLALVTKDRDQLVADGFRALTGGGK